MKAMDAPFTGGQHLWVLQTRPVMGWQIQIEPLVSTSLQITGQWHERNLAVRSRPRIS